VYWSSEKATSLRDHELERLLKNASSFQAVQRKRERLVSAAAHLTLHRRPTRKSSSTGHQGPSSLPAPIPPLLGMTVARQPASEDDNLMERVHLNFGEWVTTFGAKATDRLFAVLDEAAGAVRSTRAVIVSLSQRAKTGHLRLQEALKERESRLAKLLSDSPEPVVVTDDAHRVVDANPAGLALFGVSKANIGQFTIDAFLTSNQTHFFERVGPPFIKGTTRLGECQIRRLDGKLQIVNFSFQPNFILGRHVSRFQEVKCTPRMDDPRGLIY